MVKTRVLFQPNQLALSEISRQNIISNRATVHYPPRRRITQCSVIRTEKRTALINGRYSVVQVNAIPVRIYNSTVEHPTMFLASREKTERNHRARDRREKEEEPGERYMASQVYRGLATHEAGPIRAA